KRMFKPEFLNRLDDMIVFHQLERNDLAKIVELEVAKVIERVHAKDIKVHLERSAVEFLIDKGYDPTYGARPMRRAVEKYLEHPHGGFPFPPVCASGLLAPPFCADLGC